MTSTSELRCMIEDARRRTLDLVSDLSDAQMQVPRLDIVNPPIWELGHVAWFHERWALRHLRGREPLYPNADELWNSAVVAHDDRWRIPLPTRAATLDFMRQVLERELESLPPHEIAGEDAYFYWLSVMHEDMHDEAFTYTRQTLGYPAAIEPARPAQLLPGDLEIPGGTFRMGAEPGEIFVFDNEKWAHEVEVAPFAIARAPVTCAEFAEFVNDGGYRRREFWSGEGWQWRERADAKHPVYWMPDAGGNWQHRYYDRIVPLGPGEPVMHVNWYEAEAWCRWAGRRLPSEAEWDFAAPELPATGLVWEWTASDFLPYPGFAPDPYKEYSEPWFGSERKVLRGGCWATRERLIRRGYRNYFTRERRDIFAGFRTAR